jgi:AP2 domain
MLNIRRHDEKTIAIILNHRTKGEFKALVDADQREAIEALDRLTVYEHKTGKHYARTSKQQGQKLLYKYLYDVPRGYFFHFHNEDTFDYRRSNIYVENKAGDRIELSHLDSRVGYAVLPEIKGVTYHKASERWTSRPYVGRNKRVSLGYFQTKEEAIDQTLILMREGIDSPRLKRNGGTGQ